MTRRPKGASGLPLYDPRQQLRVAASEGLDAFVVARRDDQAGERAEVETREALADLSADQLRVVEEAAVALSLVASKLRNERGSDERVTLVEFLAARLAEDEQIARAVEDRSPPFDGQWKDGGSALRTENDHVLVYRRSGEPPLAPGLIAHLARHDPARVLAEVNAKRQLIDEHRPNEFGLCSVCVLYDDDHRSPCPTLRLLALLHADHPDYRDEWRP